MSPCNEMQDRKSGKATRASGWLGDAPSTITDRVTLRPTGTTRGGRSCPPGADRKESGQRAGAGIFVAPASPVGARSAAPPRSVVSPDLEGSRRVTEDLVLDRYALEARFAHRSVRRSGFSARLYGADGNGVVGAIVPVKDGLCHLDITAFDRELDLLDILLPSASFALNLQAWTGGVERLLAEHEPFVSSSGASCCAHQTDSRGHEQGRQRGHLDLHFCLPFEFKHFDRDLLWRAVRLRRALSLRADPASSTASCGSGHEPFWAPMSLGRAGAYPRATPRGCWRTFRHRMRDAKSINRQVSIGPRAICGSRRSRP